MSILDNFLNPNNDERFDNVSKTDEPSGFVKKGLSSAAKIIISSSKKIISSVVSNYRPPTTTTYLVDEIFIKRYIERSIKYGTRNKFELREIALNNMNTILLSKEINDSLISEFHEEVDDFKRISDGNENNEFFRLRMQELKELKIQLDQNSEFMIKFKILESILSQLPIITISNLISSLFEKYPEWSNPLIAKYIIDNDLNFFPEKCIIMLLNYYPCNVKYLKKAKEILKDENCEVFDNLIDLYEIH